MKAGISLGRAGARLTRHRACLAACIVSAGLGACVPHDASRSAAELKASEPAAARMAPKRFSLGIAGYNYTNTAIESFTVSHAGGDSLSVSSPSGGGGGTVCCVSLWLPLSYTPKINVRWWRNDKTCEIDVPLQMPVPADPKTMTVHFYEDGRVEAEASDDAFPSPRLKLERYSEVRRHKDDALNIVNDERFAKCTHGYR